MSICYFRAVVNPSTPIMENCLENFEKIGTFLIKNPKMITFFSQICRLLADLTKNLIFRKKYPFIKENIRFSHYFYSVVSNCPSSVFVAKEQILSRDCLFTKKHTHCFIKCYAELSLIRLYWAG